MKMKTPLGQNVVIGGRIPTGQGALSIPQFPNRQRGHLPGKWQKIFQIFFRTLRKLSTK
jgi:hypothetical protein